MYTPSKEREPANSLDLLCKIFDKTFIVICLMFGSKSYWPNERSTVQSYSSIAHIHTFIFMPRKANVIISPLKQSVDLENGAKNSSIKHSKDNRE